MNEEHPLSEKIPKTSLEHLCIKYICQDMQEYENEEIYIKVLPNCLKQGSFSFFLI
jgi:hypothetical protein